MLEYKLTLNCVRTDDSMSEHTSDAESYVFEDVMMPSSHLADADINDSGHQSDDSSDSSDDTPTHHHQSSSYPKLMLTNEERRLLDKEGISLPGNYPLTKHEERELKRIRRKIRNKISAQDSRKRKKEYVDGLEERVKQCTDENQTLIKRLKLLQSQHNNLTGQVKKLQAMLSKGTNKTAQPATCLMVLLLSLALVAVPNLKLGQNAKDTELADALQEGLLANRRNLLFDTNEQLGDVLVDEEMSLEDILGYSQDINEHDYAADVDAATIVAGVSPAKRSKTFIEFDVDDRIWRPPPPSSSVTDDSKEFFGKAATYQQYLKSEQAAAAGLLANGIKQEIPFKSGIYEINLDQISMLAGNTDQPNTDTILQQQQKLNDSKIAIGERKILMKGV